MVGQRMAGEIMEMMEMAKFNRTLTEELADYWADARFEDLPENVVHAAKRVLLDTIGVGIAGSNTDVGRIALRAMQYGTATGSGTGVAWGAGMRLPPAQAALVNGTASHVLELDDYGGCGHSGAVVIPAVLALALGADVRGADVLTAIVAGYDVSTRVLDAAAGYTVHNALGWHSTGTCGPFGAAAGAAKILRLGRAEFADSVAIAGTFTGGIWAFLVDGAMTKRLHAGKAAETGVAAALLASAGMSGPRHILEAEWGGFFSTYVPGRADRARVTQDLGSQFKILESGMKPYACCRGVHGSIDGLQQIMAEASIASRDVARIVVHGSEQTRRQFNRHSVQNLVDAQFSIPYCLAVTAESGRATFDQFSPLRTSETEIARLIALTEVVGDRELRFDDDTFLEVFTADGRVLTRQIQFPKGAPQNPVSDDELIDKFHGLVEPVIGATRATELTERVFSIEDEQSLPRIASILSDNYYLNTTT
jgi:2-methylcitrate dehydratase PrpD